jgi:hypothetical protein
LTPLLPNNRPGPNSVIAITGLEFTWNLGHSGTMELDHASSPNQVVGYIDGSVFEAFDPRVSRSKDLLHPTPELPLATLITTQTSVMHPAFKAICASSPKQSHAMDVGGRTSQVDQPKAKIACLRCRGKKSRCSGQRPCGGCSNDGLDCTWDDDEEAKLKRRGRKPKLAESTRKTSKGNNPLQVRSACTRCQHRKARCTGTRPACAYCAERDLECTYDVAEGETRTNDLKRRLKDSEIKVHAFGRILAVMREGNIYQATEVLARLRMGETPRDVLQSLPTSIASPSPNSESVQSELLRRFSA